MNRPGDPSPQPPDESPAEAGFRLRPISGADVPTGGHAPHHNPAPALKIRPLADPAAAIPSPPTGADHTPIEVLDPDGVLKPHARTHLNPHYETRLARFLASRLRSTRDWLYLISLALLVVALIGFLFQLKPLLHLGGVGVVLANILMLVDGIAYLMVVPFRTSLAQGLGVLLVPPYAVYYWIKHWDRMRKPLFSTVGSFLPIGIAALAYFAYEEAPVIWDKVEQADRVVEKAIGIEPGPAPAAQPRQPSVADQAKQVLGNEANIIQQLAKPQ